MRRPARGLFVLPVFAFSIASAMAQSEVCPDRPVIGATVKDAVQLHSVNGTLSVDLTMVNNVDDVGISHYCYLYADGSEAPTLVVKPGDRLVMNITNHLTEAAGGMAPMSHGPVSQDPCDGGPMSSSSTNVHFHGLNIPPRCHQDETIRTTIQPGQTFQYSFDIPANDPPGLFWYHPHMHGFATTQITGGAAGALIIEGIEQMKPEVAGLPQRVFVIRQFNAGQPPPGAKAPPGPQDEDDNAVLSVNFVPAFEKVPAPVIRIQPGERQLWRIVNATAIHFLALQIQIGLTPQPVQLVALDGVPLDESRTTTRISLPPAGRAEFIVEGPPGGSNATLTKLAVDTGPDGDLNGATILAKLLPGPSTEKPAEVLPAFTQKAERRRFVGLEHEKPAKKRQLYFSEVTDDAGNTDFFITVKGQTPKVFDPRESPRIVTKAGTVEDWVIENRSKEVHDFHIHQIHFIEIAKNGVPVHDGAIRDSILIPYWDGESPTYPSVTLRMDFRDPDIAGTFMYQCHILDHGDGGMMAKIKVEPK
jgi:FtsP/CotA-like multicopper oxidase with cupredoxin domain